MKNVQRSVKDHEKMATCDTISVHLIMVEPTYMLYIEPLCPLRINIHSGVPCVPNVVLCEYVQWNFSVWPLYKTFGCFFWTFAISWSHLLAHFEVALNHHTQHQLLNWWILAIWGNSSHPSQIHSMNLVWLLCLSKNYIPYFIDK